MKNLVAAKAEHPIIQLTYLSFAMLFLLCSPDAFAVGNSPDAGLNTSVGNLVNIVNHNLIPIILLCGCLAGAALSFMKSSPAPFIVALITTVSLGFARSWINGTYAVLV